MGFGLKRERKEVKEESRSNEFEEKLEEKHPETPTKCSEISQEEKEIREIKLTKPILEKVPNDFISMTIALRWIGFLLERVDRKTLPLLLDYYKDIGWISDYAKKQLLTLARGVVQDVSYGEEELVAEFGGTTVRPEEEIKRSVEDWRLPAEDHIKSLIFIMRIKGEEVDKDLLNSIELEIKKLRRSLENYYGI